MTKVLISMGLRLTTQSSEARSVVFASAGGKMAFDSATKFSRSMSSFHRLPASPVSPTHSTDRPGKWDSDIKGIFLHKSWIEMSLNSISAWHWRGSGSDWICINFGHVDPVLRPRFLKKQWYNLPKIILKSKDAWHYRHELPWQKSLLKLFEN